MAVLAEVCARRRQTEECVTAFREGQGEKTLAAVRHDVLHERTQDALAAALAEQPHSIYRNIDLGMVCDLQCLNYIGCHISL